MAYIPPHRRNPGDGDYIPQHFKYGGFRVVKRNAISKWFIVPSLYTHPDIKDDGGNPFACSVMFTLTEWEYQIDKFILTSIHPRPKDISGDDGQSSAKHFGPIEIVDGVTPTILLFNYYPELSKSRSLFEPLADDGQLHVKNGSLTVGFPTVYKTLRRLAPGGVKLQIKGKLWTGLDIRVSGVERCEIPYGFVKSPWRCIAEEIQQDLVTSFQELRTEMFSNVSELISPSFIVRLGTNLLHGVSLTTIRIINLRTALRRLFREHRTDIPDSDVEVILKEVIPKIGVDFTAMKEYYYVKVFDKYRKHANVTCKCNVNEDVGELDLCKIELNQERHLIIDISYLDKKLDPRLMLSSKRILTTLTDNEKQCLRTLIKSAIIDSEEMGGLRWPVEKDSLGDRYAVIGVWHIKSQVYKNSSMRLKLRYTDHYNFRHASGDVSQEVILEMTEIDRNLRDAATELSTVIGLVDNTLKLLWDHFL